MWRASLDYHALGPGRAALPELAVALDAVLRFR